MTWKHLSSPSSVSNQSGRKSSISPYSANSFCENSGVHRKRKAAEPNHRLRILVSVGVVRRQRVLQRETVENDFASVADAHTLETRQKRLDLASRQKTVQESTRHIVVFFGLRRLSSTRYRPETTSPTRYASSTLPMDREEQGDC